MKLKLLGLIFAVVALCLSVAPASAAVSPEVAAVAIATDHAPLPALAAVADEVAGDTAPSTDAVLLADMAVPPPVRSPRFDLSRYTVPRTYDARLITYQRLHPGSRGQGMCRGCSGENIRV